jgi:hypothetical protein
MNSVLKRSCNAALLCIGFLWVAPKVSAQQAQLESTIPLYRPNQSPYMARSPRVNLVDAGSGKIHVSAAMPSFSLSSKNSGFSTHTILRLDSVQSDTMRHIVSQRTIRNASYFYQVGFVSFGDSLVYLYQKFEEEKQRVQLMLITATHDTAYAPVSLLDVKCDDIRQFEARLTRSKNGFAVVYMQLEDRTNARATLTWKVFDRQQKERYERSEKLNFGGGEVELLDAVLTPEFVVLTTLNHINSSQMGDAVSYYVCSEERTAVFQGRVLPMRSKVLSESWVRYRPDSTDFVLHHLVSKGKGTIPHTYSVARIPLERVDQVSLHSVKFAPELNEEWKNDVRPFTPFFAKAWSYMGQLLQQDGSKATLIAGLDQNKEDKVVLTQLLLVPDAPGLDAKVKSINIAVSNDFYSSAVGRVSWPEYGSVVLFHGPGRPEGSKKLVSGSIPMAVWISESGFDVPVSLPVPLDCKGGVYYEGAYALPEKGVFLLPYRTKEGIAIATYRLTK